MSCLFQPTTSSSASTIVVLYILWCVCLWLYWIFFIKYYVDLLKGRPEVISQSETNPLSLVKSVFNPPVIINHKLIYFFTKKILHLNQKFFSVFFFFPTEECTFLIWSFARWRQASGYYYRFRFLVDDEIVVINL